MVDLAVFRLLGYARTPSLSDTTKVHIFNVLKITLLDTRQSPFLERYFEKSVITALEAFESSSCAPSSSVEEALILQVGRP